MSNIIDSIRLSGTTYQIQGSGGGGTQTVELTQAQYDALVDKDPNTFYIITDAEAGDLTNYYTKTETNTLLGGKQATLISGTNIKTINNESILGSGNIDIQGGGVDVVQTTGTSTTDVMSQDAVTTQLNGKQDSSKLPTYIASDVIFNTNQVAVIRTLKSNGGSTRSTNNVITINNQAIFNNSNLTNLSLVETSAITTTVSSSSTDAQVPSAKAVYDAIQEGGGGGGGKTIEAGRGISITTGETADTVSFSLPISANTNNSVVMGGKISSSFTNNGRDCLMVGSKLTTNNGSDCSLVVGYNSSINGDGSAVIGWSSKSVGDSSFAFGTNVSANTSHTFAAGYVTIANNNYEASFGKYNASNTGSTYADKTIFSVGNGTADNARHNAFEIRQNGDIYCSDGTNDVKLQDTITATASNTTALGGLSLVKLTQAEYDALATKDNSTLYVIVN